MRKMSLVPYVLLLVGSFVVGLALTIATSQAIARGARPTPGARQTAPVKAPPEAPSLVRGIVTTEC